MVASARGILRDSEKKGTCGPGSRPRGSQVRTPAPSAVGDWCDLSERKSLAPFTHTGEPTRAFSSNNRHQSAVCDALHPSPVRGIVQRRFPTGRDARTLSREQPFQTARETLSSGRLRATTYARIGVEECSTSSPSTVTQGYLRCYTGTTPGQPSMTYATVEPNQGRTGK